MTIRLFILATVLPLLAVGASCRTADSATCQAIRALSANYRELGPRLVSYLETDAELEDPALVPLAIETGLLIEDLRRLCDEEELGGLDP